MSEYEAKDYIKFIEIDRRDKISPYGLKEIAKKYRELEQQNKELKEIGLMLKDRIISVLNNKPVNDLDEIIARLEKYEKI